MNDPSIPADDEQAENLRALHLADRVLQLLIESYRNNDMNRVERMLQSMCDQRTCSMALVNANIPSVIMH